MSGILQTGHVQTDMRTETLRDRELPSAEGSLCLPLSLLGAKHTKGESGLSPPWWTATLLGPEDDCHSPADMFIAKAQWNERKIIGPRGFMKPPISCFTFCLRRTTGKEHSLWEQITETVSDSKPASPGFC